MARCAAIHSLGVRRQPWRSADNAFAMTHIAVPERFPEAQTRAVHELAETQHCVARREQLIDAGLSRHTVAYMLRSGRWRSDAGGLVIAMHNGPLSVEQAESLAVLAGGRVCALAARTAAARAGLLGWPTPRIEVIVPRGTTYPVVSLVDVKVHESRRFTAEDIHPASFPSRVRLSRAVIDAASWSRTPRATCGLLAAAVQQQLCTPAQLLDELDRAGAIRRALLMRAALVDIDGGAHAMSEIDFVRFCARHGLPRPQHQLVRRDSRGRRRYLDATLVGPTGAVVRVEIDGALHLAVQTYWDDMYRSNDLSIGREVALRFPSYVIYADDRDAVAQLRAALKLSASRDNLAACAS